jgi:hypothetical protein
MRSTTGLAGRNSIASYVDRSGHRDEIFEVRLAVKVQDAGWGQVLLSFVHARGGYADQVLPFATLPPKYRSKARSVPVRSSPFQGQVCVLRQAFRQLHAR